MIKKIRKGKWRTADGLFEFVRDPQGLRGHPSLGMWLVYAKGTDEPMYFGGALQRGFLTLGAARLALFKWRRRDSMTVS